MRHVSERTSPDRNGHCSRATGGDTSRDGGGRVPRYLHTRYEMRIGGDVANGRAPKDGDSALVFQNSALSPHMTGRENTGFGLKRRQYPPIRWLAGLPRAPRRGGAHAGVDRCRGGLRRRSRRRRWDAVRGLVRLAAAGCGSDGRSRAYRSTSAWRVAHTAAWSRAEPDAWTAYTGLSAIGDARRGRTCARPARRPLPITTRTGAESPYSDAARSRRGGPPAGRPRPRSRRCSRVTSFVTSSMPSDASRSSKSADDMDVLMRAGRN